VLDALIYAAVSLAIVLVLPRLLSDRSATSDIKTQKSTTLSLRSRVIISHSLHLAFALMALLMLLFPLGIFVGQWIDNKQTPAFLFLTLAPLILFSFGYIYFIRFLQRKARAK
jgi:hypothetical protein